MICGSIILIDYVELSRTFELIVGRLLYWADCVFERSVNQPLLPFAIIIVNAFEADVRDFLRCLIRTQIPTNK